VELWLKGVVEAGLVRVGMAEQRRVWCCGVFDVLGGAGMRERFIQARVRCDMVGQEGGRNWKGELSKCMVRWHVLWAAIWCVNVTEEWKKYGNSVKGGRRDGGGTCGRISGKSDWREVAIFWWGEGDGDE